jgi:hypothetical protein
LRRLKIMNNQNNKTYEHGYVVLPVEEYQKLIVESLKLKGAVKLVTTYSGQIAVEFDKQVFYDIAKQHYEASSFNTPERELKPVESFNVWTADLTDKVQTDAAEG